MATTLTAPITIPYPGVLGDLELRIQAGACRLKLTPATIMRGSPALTSIRAEASP